MAVELAVEEVAKKLEGEQKRLREIVLAMWQQSARRQGHSFVSNFIKENFKEDLFTLSRHVYKVFIDSNGDEKAFLGLLRELQPPSITSTTTETKPGSTSATPKTTTLPTENQSKDSNLYSISAPKPDGDQNVHPDVHLDAQNVHLNAHLDSLTDYVTSLSHASLRSFGGTIRVEDVEVGEEWLRDHNPMEEKPADTSQVPGRKPAEPKMNQSPPPTTPPPPQAKTITIELPPGVEPTPIAEIDAWIRKGYVNRLDLEALMKAAYQDRAYRREVQQRVDLFEARQPPFNNIPPGAVLRGGGMQPAGSPQTPANSLQIVGGVAGGTTPELPRISAPAPPPSIQQPASNLPPATNVPAEFAAARNMTDEQTISSHSLNTA